MATLMLVDDETSILEVYRNILEIRDHEILAEARDGGEAVMAYSQLSRKPDVILMDHRMPRSNGINAMKNIHALNPLQCIIFVTADYEAAKFAMTLGAHSFIMKPFRMDALFNSIEVALSDIDRKKSQIRESFMALVTRLNTANKKNVNEISERLEKEVIDKFLPGSVQETQTIETLANWLCMFFNIMGMEFSHEIDGNKVTVSNAKCAWLEAIGKNPLFCLSARCTISRFAMKTGREFHLEHENSIMGGDRICLFKLYFE
jgi:two-component system chemotaxis response regulator CheY